MPSINRPNAPNRLPSGDFGDLFFKPRALRVAEARSSVTTPSPLSSPSNFIQHRRTFRSSEARVSNPSSPLMSPTLGVTQRRPLHTERPAHRSEASYRSEASRESGKSSSSAPNAIEEEPTSLKSRTSSAASSISSKARKTLGISELYDPSVLTSEDKPPREARIGFQWKRDFLGGWLEIRVGRQRESDQRARTEPENTTPPFSTAPTMRIPLTQASTIVDSTGHASGEPLISETPDSFDTVSTIGPLREGLYCRTKRALGLKRDPINPYLETRSRTPTGAVLDRVTSTLGHGPPKAFSRNTSAATSVSNLSIAAPRKHRDRPGQRGWFSSSSSVRDLLMGHPPAGTPNPEAMYTGSDSNKYLSVDITQPDGTAFLPSEARRINTPPLPCDNPGKASSRGFFFDYNAPTIESQQAVPNSFRRVSTADDTGERVRPSDSEWYRVKLDTIDNVEAPSREAVASTIPEHLPNSPLCPRNPKHKSGGTGTCPYHGRIKSTPSDVEKTPMPQEGRLSPVPETWWMK